MTAPDPPDKSESGREAPRVAVVVLNYNGMKVLPGLLESLDRCDWPNLLVILVDNASTDGSVAYAESRNSAVQTQIIRNPANLLFSKGNNVGIRRAMEEGSRYVFLLNNDTLVPPGLVRQLVEFMESSGRAGITGPLIHFGQPEKTVWSAGGQVLTWWGIVRHRGIRQKDTGQFRKPSRVDYVSGAAMMVRREVFERIGLLDESFPMYYEDTDFCFRAARSGFECWYVPTDPLIHLVSFAAGGQLSGFKIKRRLASGLRFFARHAKWYQWPTILLGQVFEVIRVGLMVAGKRIK